jgi:hypothetical protein
MPVVLAAHSLVKEVSAVPADTYVDPEILDFIYSK